MGARARGRAGSGTTDGRRVVSASAGSRPSRCASACTCGWWRGEQWAGAAPAAEMGGDNEGGVGRAGSAGRTGRRLEYGLCVVVPAAACCWALRVGGLRGRPPSADGGACRGRLRAGVGAAVNGDSDLPPRVSFLVGAARPLCGRSRRAAEQRVFFFCFVAGAACKVGCRGRRWAGLPEAATFSPAAAAVAAGRPLSRLSLLMTPRVRQATVVTLLRRVRPSHGSPCPAPPRGCLANCAHIDGTLRRRSRDRARTDGPRRPWGLRGAADCRLYLPLTLHPHPTRRVASYRPGPGGQLGQRGANKLLRLLLANNTIVCLTLLDA